MTDGILAALQSREENEITQPLSGPLYIVTKRFTPNRGEEWTRYVVWSGLHQLREVVSLDSMLCPPVVKEIVADDWPYIVNQDFMTQYFRDLNYLLRRVGDLQNRSLLCLFQNPDSQPELPATEFDFIFEGYDVIDIHGDVSALTNCGGFPEVFSNDELTEHGLLESLERANQVKRKLAEQYVGQARSHVWGLYRVQPI